MTLLREPLLTTELESADFLCETDAIYLYAAGPEERSDLDPDWASAQGGVEFVEVEELSTDEISIRSSSVRLRDRVAIENAIQHSGCLYIDITGMTYSTWAPLVGAAISSAQRCRVVYREPLDYRRSENPARGMIYDLSERIAGIAPLPGMASIHLRRSEASVLVPLLGFEGTRLAHILENTEPDADRVIPIIGAPGFRPEYTTQAFLANRLSLEQEQHYSRIQFAKANCPFDLFHQLVEVQRSFAGAFLRIAPVGTKPHGLGAVLFALGRNGRAEIVYDHPLRKQRRTSGQSRVCLYEISQFAESDLFNGRGAYA